MKQSLKIIIFDGSFKTTTFINRLAKGLSKNHEVFIVGFNKEVAHKIPNLKYIDLGSSQHLFNLVVQSKWLAFKLFLKTRKLKQVFKTAKDILTLNKKQLQQDNFNTTLQLIQPDIVHVQWQSLLPWCEDALTKQDYKFVMSQRGYQNNVRPFVDAKNFDYLQKWYANFAGFHSVSEAIMREGDKIHPPQSPISTSSAHRFSGNTPLTPLEGGIKKVNKVVYSGFDFAQLPFAENYSKTTPLQILSVGRPHWIKGYSDTLKACKFLKEKGIDFKYTIIGAAVRNEELLYVINDLELQENVILLPKIPQKEVYQQMKEASVLLFPSITEGLPNVVVEAMALGLPVISTKCGGVEELIQHNETGFLVPTRNPEAIAEGIIEFINTSEEKIEKMRLAARQKVEEQHSEEQMVNGMEELYSVIR